MAPRAVALPRPPEAGRFDPGLYHRQLPFSADAVSALGVFFYDQLEPHAPRTIGACGRTR